MIHGVRSSRMVSFPWSVRSGACASSKEVSSEFNTLAFSFMSADPKSLRRSLAWKSACSCKWSMLRKFRARIFCWHVRARHLNVGNQINDFVYPIYCWPTLLSLGAIRNQKVNRGWACIDDSSRTGVENCEIEGSVNTATLMLKSPTMFVLSKPIPSRNAGWSLDLYKTGCTARLPKYSARWPWSEPPYNQPSKQSEMWRIF